MATQRTAQQKGRRSGQQADGAQPRHKLPDKKTALELLDKMLLIRHFEERAQEMYMKAKIGGFMHLAIGEEATIVGTVAAMRDDDYLLSTYREHGQVLARGTDPNTVMAELFGREGGTSRGRGGSMHLFDPERRFLGGYGIVGGNLPLAAGVALASDYKGEDSVTVCMFGDGASNQGTFGETMNIAALWKLPIVFVVVNNQYGMGTAIHRHSAVTDLSKKAECLGVPGERVDGMDVLAVREVMAEHLRLAREERQPTLVEALTYRFRGHSAADPEVYRTKEEVAQWRERDPILSYEKLLEEAGVLTEEEFQEHDRRAIEIVDRAVEWADASPEPALESLYDNVYVLGDQVQGWYSVDERTPEVHRGEDEPEVGKTGVAHELAEAGAAYAGRGRRAAAPPRAGGRAEERPADDAPTEERRLMAVMRYREALNAAMREEMRADESVFLMGEDVGVFQGAFKVSEGMLEEFGEKRVRDTPISENTIVGMGVGAAMAGLRPIVEIMTVNFALLAMDQIINSAAHIHYMFGGQARVPLTVRFPQGGGHQLGPTHSHTMEAMFLHVPGLLVAVPSTPGRREGAAEGGDPRRQPGDLHRAREPVRNARGGAGQRTADALRRGGDPARGQRRDDRRRLPDGDHRPARRRDARLPPRDRGRGDRPAHAPPARPRHDHRVRAQDQPRGRRRGGLAARRRWRQPRGADPGAGVRLPGRPDPASHRRGRADAVFKSARTGRDAP